MEQKFTIEHLKILQEKGREIMKGLDHGATLEDAANATDVVYMLYTTLAIELTKYLILNVVNEIGCNSTSSAFLAAAFLATTNLLRDIARNEHPTASHEESDEVINDICELIHEKYLVGYVSTAFAKGGDKHDEEA